MKKCIIRNNVPNDHIRVKNKNKSSTTSRQSIISFVCFGGSDCLPPSARFPFLAALVVTPPTFAFFKGLP